MARRRAGKKKFDIGKFLAPGHYTFEVLAIIIVVHIILSLGLVFSSTTYSLVISIIYSVFNFPLYISGFLSLTGQTILNLGAYSVLPLAAHLVYWYVISSIVSSILEERSDAEKYRMTSMVLAYFLLMFLLFSIVISFYISRLIG